jgi:hypothetical protein
MKGVPTARLAVALIHVEVDSTGMGVLQGPSSVRVRLALDKVDGLGGSLIGFDASAS